MSGAVAEGRIEARVEDGVGWLVFDHPARRNAVSEQMWLGVARAMARFAADEGVRAVVMRGAGEAAFVSGGDISEFDDTMNAKASAERRRAFREAGEAALASLRAWDRPLIAMIHGYCFGGGVVIAQEADMLIAADDASFCIPAARLGVGYPYAAIERLCALVGPLAAADLLFSARVVDAPAAQAMGLINAVAPKAELETQTRKLLRRIVDNAPLTVRAAKAAIRAAGGAPDAAQLAAVAQMIEACQGSADLVEGAAAFMAKRRPVFRGI